MRTAGFPRARAPAADRHLATRTGQLNEARETFEALLTDLLNAYGESHPAVEKVRELLSGQPAD